MIPEETRLSIMHGGLEMSQTISLRFTHCGGLIITKEEGIRTLWCLETLCWLLKQ
jgi:hypothetical protein